MGCQDLKQIFVLKTLIFIGVVVEYYLGKKSTSSAGMILNIVMAVITYFKLGPAQQRLERSKKELEIAMENAQSNNIKDLIEVVDFGFELEKAASDIFQGGSVHLDKLSDLLGVYQKAVPAFENIGDVIPEIENLNAEESAELMAFIATKGVLNEHAAAVASKSLQIAVSGYDLFKLIKGN